MNRFLLHIAIFAFGNLSAGWGFAQVYPVRQSGKYGMIDDNGSLVVTPVYDAVYRGKTDHIVVVKEGRYGLLAENGRTLIEPEYQFLEEINDRLVRVNVGAECENGDCKGGKWGIVDLETRKQLPPKYDLISAFDTRGFARINIGGECQYSDCKGGKWGLVDSLLDIRVRAEWDDLLVVDDREAFVKGKDGWGRIDLVRGAITVAAEYEELHRVIDNRISFSKNNQWGLLDNAGNLIMEPEFAAIQDGRMGYLTYRIGKYWGLADSLGKRITLPDYAEIYKGPHHWVFAYTDRWALLDHTGNEIYGPTLTGIVSGTANYVICQKGNTRGVISREGKEIVPFRFEEISPISDSLVLARKEVYYRWFDLKGELKNARKLTVLEPFENHLARAKTAQGWGLITDTGEWRLEPKYDFIGRFETTARGRYQGKWEYFYFDENGEPTKIRSFIVMSDNDGEPDLNLDMSNSAGWFFSNGKQLWGLRNPQTQRVIIAPKYTQVVVVPNSNLSKAWYYDEDEGMLGIMLVDHRTGRELTDPLFSEIYHTDWQSNKLARVVYAGSGRYGLLDQSGTTVSIDKAAYIGPWSNGLVRVNTGGNLVWRTTFAPDTLASEMYFDRQSGKTEMRYRYCEGGSWGFVGAEGKWDIPVKFNTAMDFRYDLARVKQDSGWGVIDRKGNYRLEPKYDFIEYLELEDGNVLLEVSLDRGGFGFIDQEGAVAIEPSFDEVGVFREGLVRIMRDGKWGLLTQSGELKVPPMYKELGDVHEGRAWFRNRRLRGFIDLNGNVLVPEKYLRTGDFHEGRAWVQDGKYYGFLDSTGQMVIDAQYNLAADFDRSGVAPVRRRKDWGLIDREGNWVRNPALYRITKFEDSLVRVQAKADWGILHAKGEFVVRPQYQEIGVYGDGLVPARLGLAFGYLDRTGNTAIQFEFPRAERFNEGRAAVFVNGRWGYLDTTGTLVIENRFAKARMFIEGRAAVRVEGKWGFIDRDGRLVVGAEYDEVNDYAQGRAAVYRDGQGWGFIDLNGTEVIPVRYEAVGTYENGVVPVRLDRKWGLLNAYGAALTTMKYDEIRGYSEGLAAVRLQRKKGLVDLKGNLILEPNYDVIRSEGTALQVETGDRIGYLRTDGSWIWQPSR